MESDRSAPHPTTEIRLGGLGGQGIVLAATLLGQAAVLFEGREAVCTQTHGPEARGGASRADVVISDSPIDYPFVTEADILVVLFQEAYVRFRPSLRPGGVLITEADLVTAEPEDPGGARALSLPATRIAEALGSRLATNVVALGYLVGATGVVERASVEQAIRGTLREPVIDLNLRALEAGFERGRSDVRP